MHEYQISQEAFKAWLGSNFRTIVGRAVSACDCPLVNFVKTIEPRRVENSIRTGGSSIVIGHDSMPLPDWAKFFIMRLDRCNDYNIPITGQAALGFLP